MSITEAEKKVNDANVELHQAVMEAFPMDTSVEFKGPRGKMSGLVTGHDGESVIIDGKFKRHYKLVG